MRKIEILGPGCARCRQTHRIIQHVVEQEGLEIEVVKDESLLRMAALDVISVPAVAVDGKVVVSGRVPTAAEMRVLLRAN